MLETILVLPMYLVFIAVIFFVGEAALYRNLLLQMDQHDLWSAGSREAVTGNDVAEDLFGNLGVREFMGNFEISKPEQDEKILSSNGWWQKNALKNNAILKVPGWISAVRVLTSEHPVNYGEEFNLRENDKKLELYSRNQNDHWRNGCKNGEDLCADSAGNGIPVWVSIMNENYAGNNNFPAAVRGDSVSAYQRRISDYGIFTGEQ